MFFTFFQSFYTISQEITANSSHIHCRNKRPPPTYKGLYGKCKGLHAGRMNKRCRYCIGAEWLAEATEEKDLGNDLKPVAQRGLNMLSFNREYNNYDCTCLLHKLEGKNSKSSQGKMKKKLDRSQLVSIEGET